MQPQSTLISEANHLKQVQLTNNSTLTTFLIPEGGITVSVVNALFPEGLRTSVSYILPYNSVDYSHLRRNQLFFTQDPHNSVAQQAFQQQHRQYVQQQTSSLQTFIPQQATAPQTSLSQQVYPSYVTGTTQPIQSFQQQPTATAASTAIDLRQIPVQPVKPVAKRQKTRKATKTSLLVQQVDPFEIGSISSLLNDPTLPTVNEQQELQHLYTQLSSNPAT
jgi:hypothetical protein